MLEPPATYPLLEKTRRGLAWLRRAHNAWLEDRPQSYPEEEFGRLLDETAGMETALRSQGHQGCILGDQGPCPEDAVITCDQCASIPGQKEPEPLPHQPPGPDGEQQLSLFQTYRGHP